LGNSPENVIVDEIGAGGDITPGDCGRDGARAGKLLELPLALEPGLVRVPLGSGV
jgi:hypothetical protein